MKYISDSRCENIDECLADDSLCHDNSVCVDTLGSYECVCNAGYVYVESSLGCAGLFDFKCVY